MQISNTLMIISSQTITDYDLSERDTLPATKFNQLAIFRDRETTPTSIKFKFIAVIHGNSKRERLVSRMVDIHMMNTNQMPLHIT